MGFQLRDCSDARNIIVTSTDLTAYVGSVLELDGYVGICWEVIGELEDTGNPVGIIKCHKDCEACLRTAYMLTDCADRHQPVYSTQDDLLQHIGSILKVPYYDNACFNVSVVRYDSDITYYEVDYSNSYDSCEECRELKTISPEYTSELCDTDYVDKVKCTSSEMVYQEVISRRFGTKFCCPVDKTKWEIKNEILKNQLINYTSPDLPEPYVESCCIEITSICSDIQRCTPCVTEVVEEVCPCMCTASAESPHDCHTYTFTVMPEMFLDAVGNTNTVKDEKVYFGYIPCGGTKSVTESYVSGDEGLKSFCVLGIPILGWFKADVWTEYTSVIGATLDRGDVCEETIDECNTCNQ